MSRQNDDQVAELGGYSAGVGGRTGQRERETKGDVMQNIYIRRHRCVVYNRKIGDVPDGQSGAERAPAPSAPDVVETGCTVWR